MIRQEPVTPFNMSQGPSTEHQKPGKAKVRMDASKMHMGGVKDALYQALGKGKPSLPRDGHGFSGRPSTSNKTPLHNRGGFGKVPEKREPHSTYTYRPMHSAPGQNAVGSYLNRRGSSPLGNNLNRRGSNAIGK